MTKEQKDLMLSDKLNELYEKEVAHDCSEHGIVKCKIYKFDNGWNASHCPVCTEERKKKEEEHERQKKEHQATAHKRRLIEKNLNSAMIPERFRRHSFDTFIADTDNKEKLKSTCIKYAEEFPEVLESGRCLILCGNTGTGKTHLACSIANYIIKRHAKTAVFMSVMDAIREIKETYSRSSNRTEKEAIKWFTYPDLLILDEIGVQFGSETEKLIIFDILNKRYESMKPVIVISNRTPAELKDFIGDRIVDRLRENSGKVLPFVFDSYRKTT